ncbi:alpha/beta fold hydrolase [Glycomyces harbinensis]|uniref:alpha/beta fold hydrolase n=1 Tax=Glycomyces harbinensis TaxID=58114 RepID=UPI0015A6CE1B|nr:alpha/beta hydrolase [Glycomyces harbinensis]
MTEPDTTKRDRNSTVDDHQARLTGLPRRGHMTVMVRGRPVRIAVSENEHTGGELVLLLHGLGCARECWDPVYTGDNHRRWLAIDLPGHGASARVDTGGDALAFYADLVTALVEQLDPGAVHLVAHSMGAAVALLAAPGLPVGALVSLEGNLVGEDCSLISRSIAGQTREAFVQIGFAQLRDGLCASGDPDERIWGAWFERADPGGLWEAARSLVSWCESGGLTSRWMELRHRTYLWGERSGFPMHLRLWLAEARVHEIPIVGHFAMNGNPIALAHAIRIAIDSAGTGTI